MKTIQGLFLVLLAINAPATVRFVNLNSTSPTPPFTSWGTAAINIQDAIDASVDADQILVTNGIYATGGRVVYGSLTNRVVIDKAVTVQSVNGPAVTVIEGNRVIGDSAVRCVYLTNSAALTGFTLTNGATRNSGEQSGGGVWCESSNCVLFNCIIVSNSAAQNGGGACNGALTGCTVQANRAAVGGGAYGSVLNGCTVIGNSNWGTIQNRAAGIEICSATDCIISNNILGGLGGYGAGASNSRLTNCLILNNSAVGSQGGGGGASGCTLYNCTLSGNSALNQYGGGGAYNSTLYNCTLTGNLAATFGGGAADSTLNNCKLLGNQSQFVGGGTSEGVLNNCTLFGNSAQTGGGGADGSRLNNCIVYYNTAASGSNYDVHSILNHCCTLPLTPGSITNDPALTDGTHISADSPCRGAGSPAYSSGKDIDGEPWLNPPSIGCDEYHAGAITGPLNVVSQADNTNVLTGYVVNFAGIIDGHASISFWDFGDGTFITNRLLAVSHSWAAAGNYPVVLTAANESFPAGISATVTVHVATQIIHYVNVNGNNPVAPYLSWVTAATNIQDAVDVAVPLPGSLVLVTNGVYRTGGRIVSGLMSNRVAVAKPITVSSVNGPALTVIQGNHIIGNTAVRCVYLTNNAVLTGFTLTNGGTRNAGDLSKEQNGGGVWCESTNCVLLNCVVVSNSAAQNGGGAFGGTLNDCLLSKNSAVMGGGGSYGNQLNHCALFANSGGGISSCIADNCVINSNAGGGAFLSTVYNSTISGNTSSGIGSGGNICHFYNCLISSNSLGPFVFATATCWLNNCTLIGHTNGITLYDCTLTNCIVYFNATNYDLNSLFRYCCTTPIVDPSSGNFNTAPLFLNPAANDFHLQSNSPCINAGNNASVITSADLDGAPRIAGGTVDVGAYEFQSPSSILSYAWAQRHHIPTDGSADFADTDADGLNNWQEWIAGTEPRTAASVLKMFSPSNDVSGVTVSWQSVSGKNYFLQRATDLAVQPAFSALQSNIVGQSLSTIYTDATATNGGPYFYRVGVQ